MNAIMLQKKACVTRPPNLAALKDAKKTKFLHTYAAIPENNFTKTKRKINVMFLFFYFLSPNQLLQCRK